MQDNNKEEIVDAIIPVVDKTIDKPSRMFKDLKEGDRPLSPLPPVKKKSFKSLKS